MATHNTDFEPCTYVQLPIQYTINFNHIKFNINKRYYIDTVIDGDSKAPNILGSREIVSYQALPNTELVSVILRDKMFRNISNFKKLFVSKSVITEYKGKFYDITSNMLIAICASSETFYQMQADYKRYWRIGALINLSERPITAKNMSELTEDEYDEQVVLQEMIEVAESMIAIAAIRRLTLFEVINLTSRRGILIDNDKEYAKLVQEGITEGTHGDLTPASKTLSIRALMTEEARFAQEGLCWAPVILRGLSHVECVTDVAACQTKNNMLLLVKGVVWSRNDNKKEHYIGSVNDLENETKILVMQETRRDGKVIFLHWEKMISSSDLKRDYHIGKLRPQFIERKQNTFFLGLFDNSNTNSDKQYNYNENNVNLDDDEQNE